VKDLIAALRETILLLDRSEDSAWAGQSVSEIKSILSENIAALEANGSYQKETLGLLFAPTGSIQETSIMNGWSEEYMRLSSVVDLYT
jgi:hypothetical protein